VNEFDFANGNAFSIILEYKPAVEIDGENDIYLRNRMEIENNFSYLRI
jgi:hypothetical protein